MSDTLSKKVVYKLYYMKINYLVIDKDAVIELRERKYLGPLSLQERIGEIGGEQ